MTYYSLETFDDLGVTSLLVMSEKEKTDFLDSVLRTPPVIFNRRYHTNGTKAGWLIHHQGTSYHLQFITTPVLGYTSRSRSVTFQVTS